MQIFAIAIAIIFAFPIVGQIIPGIRDLPGNLNTYSFAILMLFYTYALLMCAKAGKGKLLGRFQTAIVIFCSYGICLFSLKFLLSPISRETFQLFRERTLGLFLASTLCLFIAMARRRNRANRFCGYFIGGVVVLFVIQFACSMIESRTGQIFEKNSDEVLTNLDYRDLLLTDSGGGMHELGFNYGFSGLLGQANRFGVMLVFYNLLFMTQLRSQFRWIFGSLMGLVLLAALLNTTKTSIGTIAVTDLLYFTFQGGRTRILRIVLVFGSFLVVAIPFAGVVSEYALKDKGGSNNLVLRAEHWQRLWDYYRVNGLTNPSNVLFGFDMSHLSSDGAATDAAFQGSFENEFLLLLFNFGLLGLSIFLISFFGVPLSSFRLVSKFNRAVYLLLPLSLLICSLTMDCQTRWYTLPLIAMVAICCERVPVPKTIGETFASV